MTMIPVVMPAKTKGELAPGMTVRTLRNVSDLKSVEGTWRNLQRHPNADFDFFQKLLNWRAEIVGPYVVCAERTEGAHTLAVARLENQRITYKLGYLPVFRSTVRKITVSYGGTMGDWSDAGASVLVSELVSALKIGNADVLEFSHLPIDSATYRLAKKQPFWFRQLLTELSKHWATALPTTAEGYLQHLSKGHRHELKRLNRKIEKVHPGKVQFRIFTRPSEVQQMCCDAERVSRFTYQRGMGTGFRNSIENQQRYELAAEQGWLRGYMLYVEEEPWAFWIGTLYSGTLFLDFTGYNPDYSKEDPGSIAFLRMIESVCAEGIQQLDFGFGDAFYKSRFGTDSWQESTVCIFAPTAKGVLLNVLTTMVMAVNLLSEWLLTRTKLITRIKRQWRNRLAVSSKKKAESEQ